MSDVTTKEQVKKELGCAELTPRDYHKALITAFDAFLVEFDKLKMLEDDKPVIAEGKHEEWPFYIKMTFKGFGGRSVPKHKNTLVGWAGAGLETADNIAKENWAKIDNWIGYKGGKDIADVCGVKALATCEREVLFTKFATKQQTTTKYSLKVYVRVGNSASAAYKFEKESKPEALKMLNKDMWDQQDDQKDVVVMCYRPDDVWLKHCLSMEDDAACDGQYWAKIKDIQDYMKEQGL
ncbi:hypothetical protein ACFL59_00980 [Planctomycetota bacterium]